MPELEYSERFAEDLAAVTSARVEERFFRALDGIEMFGGLGSRDVPKSINERFGGDVRKVTVNSFDLVYTFYPQIDLVRVEALVHQRTAW